MSKGTKNASNILSVGSVMIGAVVSSTITVLVTWVAAFHAASV